MIRIYESSTIAMLAIRELGLLVGALHGLVSDDRIRAGTRCVSLCIKSRPRDPRANGLHLDSPFPRGYRSREAGR
jgi:hypothetical protein